MILEWLIQAGTAMIAWMMGTLPDTSGAAELVFGANDAFSPVLAAGIALSPWIPWVHLGVTIALVLGFYLAFFIAKITRQLITHIPQFGGTG